MSQRRSTVTGRSQLRLAVAFTVSSTRPAYLEQVLESWSQVRGIGQVPLVFCCEDGDGTSAEMCEKATFGASVTVIRNPEVLGPVANTRLAMDHAMSRGEFGIVAEEDVTVADDILEYFTWAAGECANDQAIAGVCAFTGGFEADEHDRDDVAYRYPHFCPLGWGTWRDRWAEMRQDWRGVPSNPRAWDRHLQVEYVIRRRKDFLFPAHSRTQHIGEHGMHSGSMDGWYEGTRSECFHEHYARQAFREVDLFPDG